jgi:HK97 family phage portal protein
LQFNIFGKQFVIGFKNTLTQSLPALTDDTGWATYLNGRGYSVTSTTALKIAVVIRCADVVAKTMASLGCHLYQTTGDSKERAVNHPLYRMLRMMPNPETTAYEFWHMYIFSLMMTSGAFAKIMRDVNGYITGIWNIPTKNVVLSRNPTTGERYIVICEDGRYSAPIYETGFMYTPGLRFSDGNNSEDFVKIAADVLGLTINLNSYAKDYFESGSNMGGFVEYPVGIGEESFKKFKEEWGQTYSGVVNQHKWAILEGGFKVNKLDSSPENSQALESRKFQILEVCRMMGVPPHKAFAMETTSYNSMEQANIEYAQETIDPKDEQISQTIFKDLLTSKERLTYSAHFNVNKLLKGDTAARTTFYNIMRQNGVYNANDIRRFEDMNDISEEDGGNSYLVNGNMIGMKWAKDNKPKSLQGGNV